MMLGVKQPQQSQRGFTLLETLVALLILSIGLLGLASLQLTNVKNSRDAYYRTQAMILAQDIAERMRANRQGVEENAYHATLGAQNANCRQLSGCTWSQLAGDDVYLWVNLNNSTPPCSVYKHYYAFTRFSEIIITVC